MSYRKITSLIAQKSGKGNPKSPLYPTFESVFNLTVLTTKKASELIKKMEIDINEFSGNPKIILQIERDSLSYPDHIDSGLSPSDQNLILEDYVIDLLSKEGLSIKLESKKAGGIFKWLPNDERLLLITLYTVDSSRAKHKQLTNSPMTLYFTSGDRSAPPYPKQIAKLVYLTLIKLKETEQTKFDAGYKRFLDNSFKPFETFLYNERLAIRDPKYRPKCKYIKRTFENEKDRVFLEVEDPPRQITESGNAVIPMTITQKSTRFSSGRISDYDEFNSLLIFEEGYRLKDWPNEGFLLLEGDMASNRRKTNAIRQLKSRGLRAHARLADVIIRPWGLSEVFPVPRSYFNPGISHDNPQSQPQANAVDIALTTPDVTLIHGPPGTGKTTVIVEIIRHVISNGGRVIMCAPTHVAVDNVLERTADIRGISAIRVGGTAYMDEELKVFMLSEKAKSYAQAIPNFNPAQGKDRRLSTIQSDFLKQMESKGQSFLEKEAITQANLICGTTIGIARFEPPIDKPIDFDVLIIDEASKATMLEFLVPAIRAKKWILVGDHRQLPPYVNEQEIRIYVQRYFEQLDLENSPTDSKPKDTDDKEESENGKNARLTIYNERTNELIASLRRFHEEFHAMGEGNSEVHWKRLIDVFNRSKKPIKGVEEMVNIALGSCFHYFLNRLDSSRNARLIVQHRMPTILADFLDVAIYKGNLKTSHSAATHGLVLPKITSLGLKSMSSPMTFISTEQITGNSENPGRYKGFFNTCEAEVIAELISQLATMDVKKMGYTDAEPMTIGVITYYAGQSREINKHLRSVDEIRQDRGWRYFVPNKPIKIRVSIVDRFQGQEQDIVILSLTRSNKKHSIGFLKNLQRVNVSLSRAKQNLLIVGNAHFFMNIKNKPDPILKQLARYCYKNSLIKKAEVDEI
ncbi:MAG: AAA family ATPase [Candidatus Heimdallarchaeota archaeon]|nr:AAA family ATPase [Candidatus Heimdallarchaeota archaeon]